MDSYTGGIKHLLFNQTFLLLTEKAIVWEEEKALILADLHLGKTTHFRKSGIPLPKLVELDNYDRFSYLLLNHTVEKVFILGDLFHSDYNSEWDRFRQFLKKFIDIKFFLIMGNHDILGSDAYDGIDNLEIFYDGHIVGPFLMTHFPLEQAHEKLYNLCGHIHPSVKLKGQGLQRLRIPCFAFKENMLIMPAFGAFTGTKDLELEEEDEIYAVTDRTIIKVL